MLVNLGFVVTIQVKVRGKSIDDGNKIVSLLIDLQRAFVIIYRNKLFKICEGYWLRGIVLKWIQHYLHDRYQKTKTGNKMSNMLHLFVVFLRVVFWVSKILYKK